MLNPITKESPPEDVVIFLSTLTMPANTIAEVVGVWTWLEFEAKPSQEIRESLKSAGFRWIKTRGKWAHCGGKPSRKGTGDPRYKYPTTRINVIEEQEN